jgi:hypothetical protein
VNHRALLAAALCFAALSAARGQAMFPVPAAAQGVRHLALEPGVYEQDSFFLEVPYPSTLALAHYEHVLAHWHLCRTNGPLWDSFGDASGVEPRFHHQLVRYWVSKDNSTAVTLLLRYTSSGAQYRAAPDSSRQTVFILRHSTKDAKVFLKQFGAVC